MQFKWGGRFLTVTALLVVAAVMSACGGGGSAGGGAAKTTISGAVTFPAMENVVAKRAAAAGVIDSTVTVEVFGLDGKVVASVSETSYDSTQKTYSYSVPGLPVGVDYVLKVKRGIQVLKKLIEKKDVVEGVVAGQTVDAISTATVVIASQKLSTDQVKVTLGDVPAANQNMAALSTAISGIKPALIEFNVSNAVTGGKANLTAETANYANIFNMVVVAVSDSSAGSIDKVLAGTTEVRNVPFLTVDDAGTVSSALTTFSSTTAASVVTETVDSYTPPATDSGMAQAKAEQYVANAKTYLNRQDIANASLNFELALDADSANAEAIIGGAITSGIMLLDDEQFKAIAARWDVVYPTVNEIVKGTSPVGNPFNNFTTAASSVTPNLGKSVAKAPVASAPAKKMLAAFAALKAKMPQQKSGFKSVAKELGLVPATAPSVGEMQTLIDNVIIPRLDKIMTRLAKVEGKGKAFTVTKAMQGNPIYGQDVVLADGEFYVLDTALNLFQTLFKFSTAYNFDVPSAYTYDTIKLDPLAMINSPTVFTLKADGADKMKAALAYAKAAAAKAKLAYDAINARSAGTGAFDIAGLSDVEKADFLNALSQVTAALAGPTTIQMMGKEIAVDFTKFFTTPLDRTDLPTFAYDVPRNAALSIKYGYPVAGERTVTPQYWNGSAYVNGISYVAAVDCNLVPKSNIPDFTLNGILPNNSPTNNVADFTGLLPVVNGQILSLPGSGDLATLTWSRTFNANKFYFYRTGTTNDAKVLDVTTGVMTTYFNSVSGVPANMKYQGLRYYPTGIYAMLSSTTTAPAGTTTTSGFYPITVGSDGVCQIGSVPVQTVVVPPGKNSFTMDSAGAFYLINTNSATSTFTLYSTVDPTAILLSFNMMEKTLLQVRNGIISVYDRNSDVIQQYQINAAGTGTSLIGTYINVDYDAYVLATSSYNSILASGGGYYWVFDGNKLIQYAGKVDGTNF